MLGKLIQRARASVLQRLLRTGWANRLGLKANLPGDPSVLVNSFYKAAFGRLADPEGLVNRIHQLQSGVSLEVLAEELVGSPEFQTRHGSNQKVDKEYLASLYRHGLEREPDPEGLSHWLAEAERGATQAKVLAAFAGSDEAIRVVAVLFVNSLYRTAFGRVADPDGLALRVDQLQSKVSLEDLAAELVASAEFQARHGSSQKVDTRYLTTLYRDGLGREPDPDSLASWLATGENGATRAQVLAALASSDEAINQCRKPLVNCFYRTAFGRLADEPGLANALHQLQTGVSLKAFAEGIVRSTEFQARHGSSLELDVKYVRALYRDGLGRQPDLESLAFWLGQRDEQGIRATLLASVAGSDEALESLLSRNRDEQATYERWIVGNDTISDLDRATIRAHIADLPFHPLISVIMRIDRTSGVNVCEMSKSLARQLYPYWELCIAVDDLSEEVLAATPLTSVAQRTRVTQTHNTENEWAAINAALSLATGDFVAFLRPGDILPEHALYEVAFELGKNQQTDIVYTDHDQIGPDGKRTSPWFKPGWDPDLLLGQNYIRDLTVYRRTLVESAGFLRPGFEGAEFHELALRVTSVTTPDRIGHIPAILYHRRDQNQADPKGPLSGLDSGAASHRAVRQHLDCRDGTKAQLDPVPQLSGAFRVVWPLPMPEPLVSVIVPTRDRADLLAQCVDGVLHRTDYRNRELLIVDNGSTEQDALVLFDRLAREEDGISILRQPGPFNYSAMNNAAARKARGEVLVLLNNDVDVLEPGWLRELVTHALRLDVGAVGAKLLYKNGQIQHAGIVLGPEGAAMHLHRFTHRNDTGYCGQLALTRSLSAVTGACIAIRRSVFIEVGGFDEINLAVAYNDVDLCLRLGDYGYRVVWTPFAELLHLESASRGLDPTDPAKQEQIVREWQHLRKTWGSLLESADPFHNPNILFGWDFLELPSTPRREKPWHLSLSVPLNFEQRAAPAKILRNAQ